MLSMNIYQYLMIICSNRDLISVDFCIFQPQRQRTINTDIKCPGNYCKMQNCNTAKLAKTSKIKIWQQYPATFIDIRAKTEIRVWLFLLSQPRNLCWVLFIPGEHKRSLTNSNDVLTQHMLSRSQKWNHYFKILYMIQLLQLITGRCLTFLYWIIINQLKELFFEAFFRQTAKLKAAVIFVWPLEATHPYLILLITAF